MRAVLLFCWTLIVVVLFNGLTALISVAENDLSRLSNPGTYLNAFLLPKWLLAADAPLALKVAIPAGILAVLAGCLWATQDLVRQARHEHRSVIAEVVEELLPGHSGPPVPRIAEPDKLPLPATLVGRDAELAELEKNLRDGQSMGLFAVRGTGGVGKTALAAWAVAELSNDPAFPGGAVWVPCEGLRGLEGLARVWADVARQLGLDGIATEPDPDARRAALAAALAQRERTLIALDNVEPGLDGDALLDTLARPGHTAVLITARQQVAPHRLTSRELKPLEEPDARTLFDERLRQADQTRPTAEDEAALPGLLELLGGLPLSVEMTAAYAGTRRVSLAEVIAEVREDGLSAEALSFDPKRAPATRFERSWQALAPSQQQTFAGLFLIAGATFPREAALAVAEAAGGKAASDLGTLVDYSLLDALTGGQRLRLHPQLREFAQAKLGDVPTDQQERLGDAALAWWITFARAHPGYEGMNALEAEAVGLMGALEWAHAHERSETLLKLAAVMLRAWDTRGRRSEELRIYEYSEIAAERLGDRTQQRWSVHQLAVTLSQMGRIAEARAEYERALALAQQLQNPAAERDEVHGLAVLNAKTGRLEEARAGFEQALALARQLQDPSAEQAEVHELAVLNAQTGRLEEARAGYEQALALARQLQDPSAEAAELRNLGIFLAQQMSERAVGREYIQESLAICERLGAVYETGKCHQFLAVLDEDEGNRSGAIEHFREALTRFEQVDSPDAEEVRQALRNLGETP